MCLRGWEQYRFPAKGRNHSDGTHTSPKRDGLVLWMERANTVEHWSRHYPSPPICSGNNGASRYSPGRPMDRAQGGRDGWARAATGAASRWAGRTKVSSWLPLTPSSALCCPPGCPAPFFIIFLAHPRGSAPRDAASLCHVSSAEPHHLAPSNHPINILPPRPTRKRCHLRHFQEWNWNGGLVVALFAFFHEIVAFSALKLTVIYGPLVFVLFRNAHVHPSKGVIMDLRTSELICSNILQICLLYIGLNITFVATIYYRDSSRIYQYTNRDHI